MSNHHAFSPSGAFRVVSCPGSYRMQKGLTEQTSDAASEGTMLHAVMAGEIELPEDATYDQALCIEKAVEATAAFLPLDAVVYREQHLSLVGRDFAVITAGTVDVAAISGFVGYVIDYKFGRDEVDPVEANWQLALYSAMVAQRFGVEKVVAIVIAPRQQYYAPHEFRAAELAEIAGEYANATRRACGSELILNASPKACQYCKAIAMCPAVRIAREDAANLAVTADNAETVLDAVKLSRRWADAAEKQAKDLVIAGEVPSLVAVEKRGNREITDGQLAYGCVSSEIDAETFMAATSVSVGKLEDAVARSYKSKHPELTLKAAKKMAGDLIAPAVTHKQSTITIERIEQ